MESLLFNHWLLVKHFIPIFIQATQGLSNKKQNWSRIISQFKNLVWSFLYFFRGYFVNHECREGNEWSQSVGADDVMLLPCGICLVQGRCWNVLCYNLSFGTVLRNVLLSYLSCVHLHWTTSKTWKSLFHNRQYWIHQYRYHATKIKLRRISQTKINKNKYWSNSLAKNRIYISMCEYYLCYLLFAS